MTVGRIFNPRTILFNRIPRVNYKCEIYGGPKLASFKNPIRIDSFNIRERNGESGTSLDPGSQTKRMENERARGKYNVMNLNLLLAQSLINRIFRVISRLFFNFFRLNRGPKLASLFLV